MPMPPPKPTTESPRDRQVAHEVGQLVRALKQEGPQQPDDLARLVGAAYWPAGRFERALAFAAADGFVTRGADGRLHAS